MVKFSGGGGGGAKHGHSQLTKIIGGGGGNSDIRRNVSLFYTDNDTHLLSVQWNLIIKRSDIT